MVLIEMNSECPSMVLPISLIPCDGEVDLLGWHDLVVLQYDVFSPGGLSVDSVSDLELVALSSDNLEQSTGLDGIALSDRRGI
jgi:hypothetical protein